MGEQLAHDQHVAGTRGDVGQRRVQLGIAVVGIDKEYLVARVRVLVIVVPGAFEFGLVRAGEDDDAAVAGKDVGEVHENDKIVAEDAAVADLVAPGLPAAVLARAV